jgi:hypothetical protein
MKTSAKAVMSCKHRSACADSSPGQPVRLGCVPLMAERA